MENIVYEYTEESSGAPLTRCPRCAHALCAPGGVHVECINTNNGRRWEEVSQLTEDARLANESVGRGFHSKTFCGHCGTSLSQHDDVDERSLVVRAEQPHTGRSWRNDPPGQRRKSWPFNVGDILEVPHGSPDNIFEFIITKVDDEGHVLESKLKPTLREAIQSCPEDVERLATYIANAPVLLDGTMEQTLAAAIRSWPGRHNPKGA
jgi:hypothetical protein